MEMVLLTLIPVDTSAEMKMNEMTLTDCGYEATKQQITNQFNAVVFFT